MDFGHCALVWPNKNIIHYKLFFSTSLNFILIISRQKMITNFIINLGARSLCDSNFVVKLLFFVLTFIQYDLHFLIIETLLFSLKGKYNNHFSTLLLFFVIIVNFKRPTLLLGVDCHCCSDCTRSPASPKSFFPFRNFDYDINFNCLTIPPNSIYIYIY